MKVLAFDCAVSGLGVAVLHDGVPLSSRLEEGREQAARLIPAIEATLADAATHRLELDLIAVTVGPGSFTGVRVGVAAARGLCVGLGVPLAGIGTTQVLSAQAVPRDRTVVAAIDSHLGDWFCAVGGGEPFVASAASLAPRLGGRSCLVVGTRAADLAAALGDAGIDAVAEEAVPDPVVLGRLAMEIGIEGWRHRNVREGLPRPLYLRGVNITLPDGARRTVD